MKAVPFKIDISDAELTDLRDRLGHARFAAQVEPGWQSGTDTAYLRELLRYWCSGYDWSERQRKLNELPQFTADIKGETIHFVHVRAVPSDRPSVPLLLLHGWPGSFVQFAPLIPLLTNPTAHGASPKTVSFDTVAPSLPGFGFSSQPEEPGMSVAKMAPLLHALMTEVLGYDRYAMRSSDLGAGVAACIGAAHKKAIIGSHAGGTNPFVMQVPDDLSREEKAFVKQAQEWMQAEMAYAQEHSSKPQTIANALADTPSGLASWIVEKLWRWGMRSRAAHPTMAVEPVERATL